MLYSETFSSKLPCMSILQMQPSFKTVMWEVRKYKITLKIIVLDRDALFATKQEGWCTKENHFSIWLLLLIFLLFLEFMEYFLGYFED